MSAVVALSFLCVLSLAVATKSPTLITNVQRLGLLQLSGPESVAFDSEGLLYTGVADGSIRTLNVTSGEVSIFAYAVPDLDATTRAQCATPIVLEHVCGRVLGLSFDNTKENLYFIDAYSGLKRVNLNTKVVELLSNVSQTDNIGFKFANDVAVSKEGRYVYFTDSSQKYQRRQFVSEVLENNKGGRLLRYDRQTGVTTTLLTGLRFPNGVALGYDRRNREEYVLINEIGGLAVHKYYLIGGKAGKSEVHIKDIGGYPDNIRRNDDGDFWVGLFSKTIPDLEVVRSNTAIANIFVQYVPPPVVIGMGAPNGFVQLIDGKSKKIKKTLADPTGTQIAFISEAEEHDGYLYFGSVLNPYIGRIPVPN